MTTIKQIEQQLADNRKSQKVYQCTLNTLKDQEQALMKELEAARWIDLDMQPGDAILITDAIFDLMMEQEYSPLYVQPGMTFYANRLHSDGTVLIYYQADFDPQVGALIPVALVADARRAWLAAQEVTP